MVGILSLKYSSYWVNTVLACPNISFPALCRSGGSLPNSPLSLALILAVVC